MSDVLRAAARDLEKKTARLMHVGCEAGAPLSEEWGDEWRALVADVRKMQHGLRAALDAGQAQPVAPAGWKLVPVWKVRRAAEILDRDGDEHGIAADLWAMLADDAAPPAPAAQPLTDERLLAIARNEAGGDTIRLTRDVGPYEVTKVTHVYLLIADAVIAEFCRVNGITIGAQP